LEYNSISGAIQIAKIHPPGSTEFLGVYWPSIDGTKTFLGKDVSFDNNPSVSFIDPDTGNIIGLELPAKLTSIAVDVYGKNTEFVQECYPEPDLKLKIDITKRAHSRLESIFKNIAYARFIEYEKVEIETTD